MNVELQQSQPVWRDIEGYEGFYRISDDGKVMTVRNGGQAPLHARIDRGGYFTVRLFRDGKSSTFFVHRLVAAAFLERQHGKPEVNHINGNKLDNRAVNLEWVTHAENVLHAYSNGLICCTSSIQVVDICTGKKYSSVREAAYDCSIPYSTCKNYLNGNRKNPTCLRYIQERRRAAA